MRMKKTQSTSRSAASRRLHAMDTAAEFVVTSGGFLVLTAVLGICLYLLWVVLPLFDRGQVLGSDSAKASLDRAAEWVMVDPYQHAATMVDRSLRADVFLIKEGTHTGHSEIVEDLGEPVSSSFARDGEFVAVGYENGTVRLGSLRYTNKLGNNEENLPIGTIGEAENGYFEVIDDERVRVVSLEGMLGDPIKLSEGTGGAIRVDYRRDPTGKKVLAVMREDGTVLVNTVRTIRPLGGGAPTDKLSTTSFVYGEINTQGIPDWLFVTADSDQVLFVWRDGRLQRYARLPEKRFERVETMQLCDSTESLTAVNMLLGSQSLIAGDSTGKVSVIHVADDPTKQFADARQLVRAHQIRGEESPVVSITPSTRDRSIAIMHENGVAELRHVTSEKLVAKLEGRMAQPHAVAISPKNDGVLMLGETGEYEHYEIEPGYPEFSIKALFGKVVYEGAEGAEYVYQSSSGDDAAETKLSLMPLIFGTLKATVFAMIFAIPIAVFAAIYSSEFVSKRVRRKVKPVVELMASLPSVVLGFIAAMVVAPFIADHLDKFVVGLFVIPMAILIGAHLWQLIPLSVRLRARSGQHLTLVAMAAGCGVLLSMWIGPSLVRSWFQPDRFDSAVLAGAIEEVPSSELPAWASDVAYNTRTQRRLRSLDMMASDGVVYRASDDVMHSDALEQLGLTHGSLRRWLNDEYGTAMPGWFLVFFPLGCIAAWALHAVFVRRRIDLFIIEKESHIAAMVVLAKFVAITLCGFVVAYIGAMLAQMLGFDPRDSIFGSFSPRNTLVVAIIMGFAVIPIIYTISEDSLQAVPMTLRTASLGSGATPWQTAIRVVFPVAASGIFSACMIGFGRAVGETMIVLMATGNTPEMEWNIFSGFRTLAANIAVELPEAPKGETHYRVLFLCGLVLFLMTFVINTMAELVRRVVRARNAGL